MADVDSGGGGGHKKKGGGSKTKKKSTKIDMTAMVDVAFLLLTFFVLTATMTNKSMMELTMPPKVEDENKDDIRENILEDKIMTLIVDENDKVGYYIGITNPEYQNASFDQQKGIRQVIRKHLEAPPGMVRCETGKGARVVKNCWDPIFVIKPRKTSKYRNLVDLLDELAITQAPKFAIDKFTPNDSLIMIGEFNPEFLEELEKKNKSKKK